MTRHLTVRMAWHDDEWNGKVCQNPEKNHYCVGSHSLLSERLARNRNLDIEKENKGKPLDQLGDYLPPCYWTSGAFSNQTLNVWHNHPFPEFAEKKVIHDKISGYSVFTWPFRLSFNHEKSKQNKFGSYPPDLEERIHRFINKFSKNESIVFFYLNYDNPISADDSKYVLVGCATINQFEMGKQFQFDDKEIKKLRGGYNMQFFPTMNWAITVSYDFEKSGVILPYKEYLKFVEDNPESSELLDEMKLLITEEDMIPNFKYVAADISDDSCIYLLSRLRKSLLKVKEHAIVDSKKTSSQLETVEKLLERAWKLRGLYPSLGNIFDIISDLEEDRFGKGNEIVNLIRENQDKKDLLEQFFKVLDSQNIPGYLKDYEAVIKNAQINLESYNKEVLEKLSLFTLTQKQIKKILFPKGNFKTDVDVQQILENPYLLCEEYISDKPDIDNEEIIDFKIGLFGIDVGLFPDSSYLTRNMKLQNITPTSPKRLRAVIIDYLKELENTGNCYALVDNIYTHLLNYPLFYKDEINIDNTNLVKDSKYKNHFEEKLTIIENQKDHFFYLKEIFEAEQLINDTVTSLIKKQDHKLISKDLQKFLKGEAEILSKKIPNFQKDQFIEERTKLVRNALKKSFFVISGKPGSGKTQALKRVIEEISVNENVSVLAPTGKASLRLREATGMQGAKTVDLFIFEKNFGKIIDDFEKFRTEHKGRASYVQNLIIDESSMLDLKRLAILFKIISDDVKSGFIKRIILVGDENQLPPIGFGKPFYDIIEYIQKDEKLREEHFIELRTNCRQQFDNTILEVAETFRGNNRYYEETLEKISSGNFVSVGFTVELWENEIELYEKISKLISKITNEKLGKSTPQEKSAQLNLLYGLESNGNVRGKVPSSMQLETFQILTPYRGAYFGTLALNDNIENEYRETHPLEPRISSKLPFTHSDKIIRLTNKYGYNSDKRRELELSNGSIGVINIEENGWKPKKIGYFADKQEPLEYLGDSEDYELAYAITIHKSQGSEFEHILVVIPEKTSLLTRELIYTALTRSTRKVTLFLKKTENGSLLENARQRSGIISRMTSIFESPEDYRKWYEPEPGVKVRSKAEYIIYKELKNADINVQYEKPNDFKQGSSKVKRKPDFTIDVNGKKFFLEHLGMLDKKEYFNNWQDRLKMYEENGLRDNLITTDDQNGIRSEKLTSLISDIMNGKLRKTDSKFSDHHYELY